MTTPIERGAIAIRRENMKPMLSSVEAARKHPENQARAVFESIDVDELARVLAESNGTPWDFHPEQTDSQYFRDAAAIKAHLLGGDS